MTTTKREFAYLVGGVGIGVYAPKLLPKLKLVKAVKYYTEVFSARNRLQKILIEEYERIDEAIQAEESFLNMINPQIRFTAMPVSFEVTDNEGQRGIRLNVGSKEGPGL